MDEFMSENSLSFSSLLEPALPTTGQTDKLKLKQDQKLMGLVKKKKIAPFSVYLTKMD